MVEFKLTTVVIIDLIDSFTRIEPWWNLNFSECILDQQTCFTRIEPWWNLNQDLTEQESIEVIN